MHCAVRARTVEIEHCNYVPITLKPDLDVMAGKITIHKRPALNSQVLHDCIGKKSEHKYYDPENET
jgi:hypothetical protein